MEGGKPVTTGAKPVNKLLSKPASANVLNARSIFVPETKTVVVRTTRSIVVDSPIKGRDSSTLPRRSVASLAKIGAQHFGLQNKTPGQTQATVSANVGKTSSFLSNTTTTASSRTASSSISSSNQTGTGGRGGSLSQLVRHSQKQTMTLEPVRNNVPPAGGIPGGLSARVKARATPTTVDTTAVQSVVNFSAVPQSGQSITRGITTTSTASKPTTAPAPAPAQAVQYSTGTTHYFASDDTGTSDGGFHPQPQSGESGLSGLFQAMGKTLSVRR